MWECPDFYPIGDKYVLTFSPMGSGDHTSVYLVGDFDYETGSFYSHVSGEINWGFDYYAPQSFLAPDGRRIMVGWAMNGNGCHRGKIGDQHTRKVGVDLLIFQWKYV